MILLTAVALGGFFVAEASQPAQEISITETVQMSGFVRAASFTVSRDAVIQATGDLTIISEGPIHIDGKIIGWEGNELSPNAGAIRLVSTDFMTIDGELIPGRGADGAWLGDAGGHGEMYIWSLRLPCWGLTDWSPEMAVWAAPAPEGVIAGMSP